jgi:hypothetical protein
MDEKNPRNIDDTLNLINAAFEPLIDKTTYRLIKNNDIPRGTYLPGFTVCNPDLTQNLKAVPNLVVV